jgi:hypothetical protein
VGPFQILLIAFPAIIDFRGFKPHPPHLPLLQIRALLMAISEKEAIKKIARDFWLRADFPRKPVTV